MIYFFMNYVFYLIILLFLSNYFKNNFDLKIIIIIFFNISIFTLFTYHNINIIYGVIVLIISLFIYYITSYFNKENKEIILIKDGNINFHELINNYSYHKLINYLKIRHIKLEEVSYCIMKNKRLIVIKNKDINYPISIILNGNLIENNLKLISKSKKWLDSELINHNLEIKNINYAYYKDNNLYFVK